jgi:hypothetical protein
MTITTTPELRLLARRLGDRLTPDVEKLIRDAQAAQPAPVVGALLDELDAVRAEIRKRAGWRTQDWLREAIRLYVERGSPVDPTLGVCPARDLVAIVKELGMPPDERRVLADRDALYARLVEAQAEARDLRDEHIAGLESLLECVRAVGVDPKGVDVAHAPSVVRDQIAKLRHEVARLTRRIETTPPWPPMNEPLNDEEMAAIRKRWAMGPEKYQADADALIATVLHERANVDRLTSLVWRRQRGAREGALDEAARECDAKRADCLRRVDLCAASGDFKNSEWFRAKAQAAEALARDIRDLRGVERIERAAIKHADGRVFDVPRPGRHHHVIALMREMGAVYASRDEVGHVQGFLTSTGRFVDRAEARRIATAADQIIAEPGGSVLTSECLW